MSLLSFFSKPAVKSAFSTLLSELQASINGVAAPAVAHVDFCAPVSCGFAAKSPAEKVVSMLNHSEYKFRSLDTLSRKSGLSESALLELLPTLPARPATRRGVTLRSWGLVKRVGQGRYPYRAPAPVASVTSSPAAPSSFAAKSPKEKLASMLNHSEYKFRRTDTLADKSGLYGAELEAALVEVGARRAVRRGRELDSWGLISRVGAARGIVRAVTSEAPVSADRQAKIDKLTAALNESGYQYRSESTLRKKLAVSQGELLELLSIIGARAAVRNGEATDLWGLESRVGESPLNDENDDDIDEDDDDFDNDAEDDWDNNDHNG